MADLAGAVPYSHDNLNPASTQRFNSETRDELRKHIKECDRQNQVSSQVFCGLELESLLADANECCSDSM